jgi:hypothetical protein
MTSHVRTLVGHPRMRTRALMLERALANIEGKSNRHSTLAALESDRLKREVRRPQRPSQALKA